MTQYILSHVIHIFRKVSNFEICVTVWGEKDNASVYLCRKICINLHTIVNRMLLSMRDMEMHSQPNFILSILKGISLGNEVHSLQSPLSGALTVQQRTEIDKNKQSQSFKGRLFHSLPVAYQLWCPIVLLCMPEDKTITLIFCRKKETLASLALSICLYRFSHFLRSMMEYI